MFSRNFVRLTFYFYVVYGINLRTWAIILQWYVLKTKYSCIILLTSVCRCRCTDLHQRRQRLQRLHPLCGDVKPWPISKNTWPMAANKLGANRLGCGAFNRNIARNIWAGIGFKNSPLLFIFHRWQRHNARARSENKKKRAPAKQARVSRLQPTIACAIIRRRGDLPFKS